MNDKNRLVGVVPGSSNSKHKVLLKSVVQASIEQSIDLLGWRFSQSLHSFLISTTKNELDLFGFVCSLVYSLASGSCAGQKPV